MEDYSIVIQAGGKSTRMGLDKATLAFNGTDLLNHMVDTLSVLEQEILVISNISRKINNKNISLFPDIIKDIGPLGGLHAGLHYARSDNVLMMACDMPFINFDIISHMLS